MTSPRMIRVNELIKREVANMIEHERFKDGSVLISVREVNTIPELTSSRIRVSVMPSNEENETAAMKFLFGKRVEFQRKLAKNMKIKNTPVLHFEIDKRCAAADSVLSIIEELGLDDTEYTDPINDGNLID